ncbi:protein THEMIS2 [Myripristis murdjan]|uniref:protein THEMIS2 n=1 Tax=Myripristis murdjan TaxID=586833 RepID=UPI001175CA56|nr:protein THEMIS2 [Myripristis murdjan]
MAGTTIALPLQQFIASLDKTCLPRILQVCSGVYFQGSIYELSGSEVCFSTGDLIKVTDIELVSVRCEDISNNDTFELPINHKGLFRVVPEKMPYSTVEEMLSLRPVGLDSCLPFAFNSHSEITLDNFTLGAGKALTVLSTEQREGEEGQVRCHFQGQQGASAEVVIPLSCRGEFYECESEECFTLQEIMSSPHLCSRRFCLNNTTMGDRSLVLSPVYQVQAIMSLRKNVVKFPSSLEVDVLDVTEQCRDVTFVTPLSLTEVLSQPDESFPVMAEILESPESRSTLHCSWLPKLNRGQQLVFHRKGTTDMVLASSLKGRKAQQYFLISQEYGGRFRKRPREFSSVYELSVALALTPGLKVSVTRNIEEVVEEGLPALSVGDQLELVRCERVELACAGSKEQKQTVEALICQRIQDFNEEEDDDDEGEAEDNEKEELVLPLYMQGHFVEKLADSKKYKLKDLAKDFTLPLDVKVVSRDTELKADPLVGLSSLRLEGTVAEPTIQASFPHSPEHCFQIPTHWLSMSVCFTKDPLPWPTDQPPKIHMDKVTEVTDTFYYEFRKQGGSDETPPPRPPKRNPSTSTVPSKKVSSKSFKKAQSKTKNSKDLPDHSPHHSSVDKGLSNLTLNSKKRPPAPPPPADIEDTPPPINPRKPIAQLKSGKALPNTYVKVEESKKKVTLCDVQADVDSDHDYEMVDETMADMVKRAQESVMFY